MEYKFVKRKSLSFLCRHKKAVTEWFVFLIIAEPFPFSHCHPLKIIKSLARSNLFSFKRRKNGSDVLVSLSGHMHTFPRVIIWLLPLVIWISFSSSSLIRRWKFLLVLLWIYIFLQPLFLSPLFEADIMLFCALVFSLFPAIR